MVFEYMRFILLGWPPFIEANPGDKIHQLLNQDINAYRMKAFENYCKFLNVFPSTTAPEARDLNGKFVGFHYYIFETYGLKKPVHVRLDPAGDQVRVALRRRWVDVTTFMDHMEPDFIWGDTPDEQEVSRRRWLLRDWWSLNGKTFRLLDLPLEIRERIYGCVIGEAVVPYPSMRCRRIPKPIVAYSAIRRCLRLPPNTLFRINKQVWHESQQFLYRNAPFLVEYKAIFTALLTGSAMHKIRKLTLCCKLDDFFLIFGFSFETSEEMRRRQYIERYTEAELRELARISHRSAPMQALQSLRKMNLTNLTICIPAPSQLHNLAWLDHSCHVTMVECLFESAWPFIRGHPVAFEGFLKNEQASRFGAICSTEMKRAECFRRWRQGPKFELDGNLAKYDEYLAFMSDKEDGGVELHKNSDERYEPMDRAITRSIKSLPVSCQCKPACCPEHWEY